jgi:formylglycine-generating enzyme required for sulfatase activity
MKTLQCKIAGISPRTRYGALLFATSLILANGLLVAQTATFTVTNANDAGAGSLRQAILDANTAPGADAITFSISSGTITLASSLPAITGAVTITGPGATGVTVNGANRYRVFAVDAGSGTVGISGLTVSNGKALGGTAGWGGANGGGGGGGAGLGGGLFVATGNVQLNGVAFSGNGAQGGTGGSQDPATVSTSGWHAAGGGGGGMGGNGANMIPSNGQFEYGSGTGGTGGSGGVLGGAGGAPRSVGGAGAGGGGGSDQQNGGSGGYGGGGGGAGGYKDPNTNPNSRTYPFNRSSGSTYVYSGGAGGFGGGGGGGTGWNAGGGSAGFGGGAGGNGTTDTNYVNTGGGGGGGAGFGGAVFVKDGTTLAATDCTFSGNTVAGGTGVVGGANGQGLGESVFLGGETTISVSTSTLTLSQTLGGGAAVGAQGALTKRGSGTLVLSAANTYAGGTTVAEGTLTVTNTTGTATGTGPVTVGSGATIAGSGKVGALSLAGGSSVAPGLASGTLSAGNTTWAGGAGYACEINKATGGTAGASSGWDQLAVTGTLTLNATSASKFTLSVVSLDASGNTGQATGFSSTSDYTFTIATATGGIVGFDANAFAVNTSRFQNSFGGTWSVAQSGNNLNLVYRGAAVVAPTQLTISNVTASQQAGTKSVAITYTLAHPQSLPCTVTMQASRDNGTTWETVASTTGAVGTGITTTLGGAAKSITWNVGTDWPAQLFPQVKVRITVDDGQGSGAAPTGLVQIPAGTFTVGDDRRENVDGLAEAPTHAVTLEAFYLAKTEMTWSEWVTVRDWAVTHGYADLASVGAGKADTHPVQKVTWYDVVKWLNAKSEKDGLVPVYYTNSAQTTIYRTGSVNVTDTMVKWDATGYRLPTEAEWEYAARGGLAGKRFPWGDTITHQQANYESTTAYAYDVSATRGYHPSYRTGSDPSTSPVASFAANGYGLHDMAGNVWERCWDWHGSVGTAAVTAPHGATSGSNRVYRGGSWGNTAYSARCAVRYARAPTYSSSSMGFRPARSSDP